LRQTGSLLIPNFCHPSKSAWKAGDFYIIYGHRYDPTFIENVSFGIEID